MAEKVRHILRLSIVFLFVLAIFFFLMIFLLGLAKKHGLKNDIDDKVPIQQNEYPTWGLVPGTLQYSWKRNYNLYKFNYAPTSGAPEINLSTVKEGGYEYDLQRTFENATWYPQKSVVSYNESYTYTPVSAEEENADETMLTINMGAYNVWYQMINKPKYYQAWQALVQAYELMLNSDYLNRLEAYNAKYYFFDNFADVQTYVLPTLTPDDQDTIYNDPDFGMSSITGLSKWTAAAAGGSTQATSDAYLAIVAYFKTLKINLTDSQMKQACGVGSMIMQIQGTVSNRILLAPGLHQFRTVDYDSTVSSQWGFAGITDGDDISLGGVPSFYTVADLNDQLPYAPEWAAFVLDPNRANSTMDYTFNYTTANKDFARSFTSVNTFMNLDSMRKFYVAYETQDFSLMQNHFLFKDWHQVDMFNTYLDEMVDHFLLQNATYDIIALASLMDKNLNNTERWLEEQLPINVAARVVSSIVKAAGTDCAGYFVKATVPQEQADTICAGQDFTDPNTAKAFMNATWYGEPYQSEFMTKTGLTNMQYAYFFADAPDYFGGVISQATGEIAVQYGCIDTANCTGAELGALQWGSLGVTNNPKASWGDEYTPKATSVMGWGNAAWLPFGAMTETVEYPQTTASQEQYWTYIPQATTQIITSKDYAIKGLGAFYNWQKFLIAYYTGDNVTVAEYQEAWGTDFSISIFIDSCRANIETQMFGGAWSQLKVSDMLNGFVNTVAAKVNGGEYFLGNDFSLYNVTTPIQNDRMGLQSNVSYGLYTGSNGVDEIGQMRIINEAAYCNKLVEVFNGTGYVNVTQQSTKLGIDKQELDDVSNGMQFPPGIENDDMLKIYDQRNLKVMQYVHEESQTLGDGYDLRLEKFTSASHGDDVNFAYNLPVFQKPYGCYGCYQDPSELRTIKLDNQNYTVASSASDYYVLVQPDSGYMYETVKNSTVFMIIGGNQTFIPYQEKVSPFPSLDPIYGAAFPLYDYSESLTADQQTFNTHFEYISDAQKTVRSSVISMSVMAAFFLVLGIVAITIYKIKDPKRKVDMEGEEVLVRNQDLLD